MFAVIITIMALELRAPQGHTLADVGDDLLPGLVVYVLSFALVGIYWNNHHHLLRAAERISGAVMWTNLFLLFWLSLIPVLTSGCAMSTSTHCPPRRMGWCCSRPASPTGSSSAR